MTHMVVFLWETMKSIVMSFYTSDTFNFNNLLMYNKNSKVNCEKHIKANLRIPTFLKTNFHKNQANSCNLLKK